ncbi:MAG: acyl CoA:acetate/3-ketoacid CoA transferase [Alphaproteobacteria bacterium]
MRNKIVSAAEAAALIRDGDTIATSGFVGIGTPDAMLKAIAERYQQDGHPRDLTLMFAAGQGDGKERGLNRLCHDGLLKRVIGGHWGLIPGIGKMAIDEKIKGWNLPQGCISHLYRDIAAGKPGTFSKVGLETFVDPRLEGGRINAISTDEVVKLVEVEGEDWLFYKAFPLHVALIRGTTADPQGNISMEREALTLDNLAMAMAARNSGGIVIAQVERVAANNSLNPRNVKLPGALVDCVVVDDDPALHVQTFATDYNPAFAAEIRIPLESLPPMPLNPRKIIARRCAMELPPGGVVNLGIGMPEGVAAVANEEGVSDLITMTAEPGVVGGIPASGLDFGAAVNTQSIIDQNQQFDFYDGGGLDMACLGMAELDGTGNVNVSRFGKRLAGAGGFINISQNARKVVFAGTFTAGGLDMAVKAGQLSVLTEGANRKCLDQVQQVTFSGARASRLGQPVLYVTERAVFELTGQGVKLTEIAPGIDLQSDVLDLMGFTPIMEDVRPMHPGIFGDEDMDLRRLLIDLRLEDRISYDPDRNTLFLNFENLRVLRRDRIIEIEDAVVARCRQIGKRVKVVVNYDGFDLASHLGDEYAAMVERMVEGWYKDVTRYTTSAFMRLKLGQKLAQREVQPHLFETRAEAQGWLEDK